MKIFATIAIYPAKKLWLFLLTLSFAILQVAYAQKEPAAEKIRINPSAAMGGTVSQYIEKVNFIPFESTSESTFGNIDQLEVTDNYYIILDRETRTVLIFTKQGKFHAKLEGKKIHPQDPIVYNFNFDKKTNLIEMNYMDNIYFFDLDAKLANRIIIKDWRKEWWGTKISGIAKLG